ncbi:MAG TPA: hypothetical protein VMW69_04960 [Spirochaetia bacterium]|nr:hypothetical protein [Spirochaetia bacterium]
MDNKMHRFVIVGLLSAAIVGCASSPTSVTAPAVSQTQTTVAPTPPPTNPPKPAQPAQQTKPVPPPVQPQTLAPAAAGDLIQKGQILVTKEEYKKTFDDIHSLIQELNRIIAAQDYSAWTTHLTPEYIKTFSDPQTLAALSDQPMLKRQSLQLSSLQDYFLDVVVPSRADARLDDLDFVSKTQVKAITVISGKRYILYNLRLENGGWKIAVS